VAVPPADTDDAELGRMQLPWASDWPHTEQFTTTPHDAKLVDLLPVRLGSDELRRRVCVENPARLYGS